MGYYSLTQKGMTLFPNFNKPLKALMIRGNLPRFKYWGNTYQVHPTAHRVQIPLQATSSANFSSFEYLGQSMSSSYHIGKIQGYFIQILEIGGIRNSNVGEKHSRSKGVDLKTFHQGKTIQDPVSQGHNVSKCKVVR